MKKRKDDDLVKLFKAVDEEAEQIDPEREAQALQWFQEARKREDARREKQAGGRDGGEKSR